MHTERVHGQYQVQGRAQEGGGKAGHGLVVVVVKEGLERLSEEGVMVMVFYIDFYMI